MSRPNPRRTVFAEDHVAARITLERERRGWTLEGLAKRMTDAGCPLAASAIYKTEQGQPRRRIVTDELVTYSTVFGIPVDQLLLDPELEAEQLVIDRLNAVNALAAAREDAEDKLIATVMDVRYLVKGSKRAKAAMDKYLKEIGEPHDFFRMLTALKNTERRIERAQKRTKQTETEES